MKSLIIALIASTAIAFSSTSHAKEFEGTYNEPTTNTVFTVKKVSDNQYSITTSLWEGTAYWDKNNKVYKGVFRYVDGAKISVGGKDDANNAVGYHSFSMSEDGTKVTVALKWDMSTDEKPSTYSITKLN